MNDKRISTAPNYTEDKHTRESVRHGWWCVWYS